MTENLLENLLPKLEEKMMILVTELEDARREIQRLNQEKLGLERDKEKLKDDREIYSKKLTDMLLLLEDAVNSNPDNLAASNPSPALKPILVQDKVSAG